VALRHHHLAVVEAEQALTVACPEDSTLAACLAVEAGHSTSRRDPALVPADSASAMQTTFSATLPRAAAAWAVWVERMRMGGNGFRPGRAGAHAKPKRAPTPEPTIVEKDLPLTLEEIFTGTSKKVKTKSKAFDPMGKRTTQEVTLEANIKPGLRAGSKIKYRNIGDQEEGGRQDVHLIVKEVCDYFNLPR